MFRIIGVGCDEERDVVEAVSVVELEHDSEVRVKKDRGAVRGAFLAVGPAEGGSVVERGAEAQRSEASIGEIEHRQEIGRFGPVGEAWLVADSKEAEKRCEHGKRV